jgi:hypothetical protein
MKIYWKSTKTLCCDESWLPIRILDGVQLRTAISSFWLPVAPVAPVYCVNALDAAPPFVTIAKYLELIFTFSQLFINLTFWNFSLPGPLASEPNV